MQGVATKRTIGRVFFWPATVITVLGGLLLYGTFQTDQHVADAQMVNFYAGDCMGGWDGSGLAAGEPQVTPQASETYTKENSAVLDNKLSPITCNHYSGTLPPETYHTRVMVRFSWKQDLPLVPVLPEVVEPVAQSIDSNISTSTSSSTTNDTSSTSESSLISESTTTVEVSPDIASTTVPGESGSATSTPDEVQTSTSSASIDSATSSPGVQTEVVPTTEVPAPPPELKAEPEPVVTPPAESETEPTPAAASDPTPAPDVVSWWPLLSPSYAHAEELATGTVEISPVVATGTDELLTTLGEIASDTASSSVSHDRIATSSLSGTMTSSDGAQFVVQYTLDGVVWQVLGYVTTVDTDVRLEFPRNVLPTLEDISHVQLSITPLLQIDTMQPVYLDAMWLEVSYAPLGELGVHSISDIVPTITSFESLISDTVASGSVTAPTSLPHMTTSEFAQSIVNIHGIDARYALLTLLLGTSTREVWLFDMQKELIHRIGRDKSQIGTMPAYTKDGMIFWLNADRDALYTYDLRTAGSLHEMTLVSNLAEGTEYVLTFPFTSWQVIWRGDSFYFKTRKTGEVFQDENTDSASAFFKYYQLAQFIPYDRIQDIGATFISEDDAMTTASSTDTSVVGTSTVSVDTTSTSTIPDGGTSTIEYIP